MSNNNEPRKPIGHHGQGKQTISLEDWIRLLDTNDPDTLEHKELFDSLGLVELLADKLRPVMGDTVEVDRQ